MVAKFKKKNTDRQTKHTNEMKWNEINCIVLYRKCQIVLCCVVWVLNFHYKLVRWFTIRVLNFNRTKISTEYALHTDFLSNSLFIHFIQLYNCFSTKFSVDDNVLRIRQQQSNFYRWIEAFRTHSHRIAQTNPIELQKNTTR